VHASDALGTAEWNTTCRPCIIMDRIKGKTIGNEEWMNLGKAQQHRVLYQIANVMAELGRRCFDRIGSLYETEAGEFFVGPLADWQCNYYCVNGTHSDIFLGLNSPYTTVMEYSLELANMRLVYETINAPNVTDRFTTMWLFRSLLPALVLNDFNSGPFILQHGNLRRNVVFFDEKYNLTGINNWEWSKTLPVQSAAQNPPFINVWPFTAVTPENASWCLKMHDRYLKILAQQERIAAQSLGQGQLIQTELREKAKPFLTVEYVLSGGLGHLDSTFWTTIFEPTFGNIDRVRFMNAYLNAPGVRDEFNRMKEFIRREVSSSFSQR